MNTTLHHRQIAPQHFTDPRITTQVRAMLKSALVVSNHAKDKCGRYLWQPRTKSVTKSGREFTISRLDYNSLRFSTSFSALLASASHENVFEIVLNADCELTKLALRIDLPTSPDTVIILVLGSELDYQSVRLVTWYLNDKTDTHSTLQKDKYTS